MSYRASWLIGSRADLPAGDMTIDASPQAQTPGSFYLYDADAGLSLLAVLHNVIAAAGVLGVSVRLNQSGHVRIGGGPAVAITWGTSTVLRDLLGFTGNLASAAEHVAPNLSPLLWMPGKPETPLAQRLGVVGHRVHNVYQTTAPYSGKSESVSHGSRMFARYAWPMVDTERLVADLGEGGTFDTWFAEVAVKSARWKLYRDVLEDPAGTASAIPTLDEPLGPYVVSGPRLTWKWDLSRGFERTDKRGDIDLACHVVEEYA